MAIEFACSCGKWYTAGDELAGRQGTCKQCGRKITVPLQAVRMEDLVDPTPLAQALPAPVVRHYVSPPAPLPVAPPYVSPARPSLVRQANRALLREATANNEPRGWRDFLYLLLLAAMIPLILYTFGTRDNAGVRLDESAPRTAPRVAKYVGNLKQLLEINGPLPDSVLALLPSDVYQALPDDRIAGSFLPRDTEDHWGLAACAWGAFLVLFITLFGYKIARPRHLVMVGVFTSTVGLALLFILQLLAVATRGWVIGGAGILFIPFWILKLIGTSYDLAFDPKANLYLSAVGFTLSVGLLEEGIKALPVIWHTCNRGTLGWRSSCLWGLASGAAFGVAEGILYSGRYYNGIAEGDMYAVRFISCVALHAVWTGSVGIIVYLKRAEVQQASTWKGYLNAIVSVTVLSMFLHGLYDTFLKKDMDVLALVVALTSFTVLALQVEYMRKQESPRPALLRG